MCNIAAALGVGLLLMMGNRGKSQDTYTPPVAPKPSTNYGSQADNLANNNQKLPNDGAGSPTTSSSIVQGVSKSKGRTGYRSTLESSMRETQSMLGLPTIGSFTKQKPVNY